MEKAYWLGRKRAAKAMARAATCSKARLIHYELAGRYSLKAAFTPFMLPVKGAAPESEREARRLPITTRRLPAPHGLRAGDDK